MGWAGRYVSRAKRTIPPAPHPLLPRPDLLTDFDDAAGRRLMTVTAGPGYGKTTQLAAWARQRGAAWYSADEWDSDPATFTAGLLAAVGDRVPLDEHAASGLPGPLGPQADSRPTVQALASALAELFERCLDHDLTVVIDDCHDLRGAGGALLASLCRQAPYQLRLVLATRGSLPLPTESLRGRGELSEIHAAQLCFSDGETGDLLTALLGTPAATLAGPVQRITGGWPAAVRLLAEALDRVPQAGWSARLAAAGRPGVGLVDYLAEEVVADSDPEVRTLWRLASELPQFNAPMCQAGGLSLDARALHELVRRGLLLEVEDADESAFAVPPLLASAVRTAGREPDSWRRRAFAVAAREWFAARGRLAEALQAVRTLDDPAALVEQLERDGDALLTAGQVAAVASAVAAVPEPARTPTLHRLAGQAHQIRGDWETALALFYRAGGDAPALPAGLAWRMGLIHHLRGELDLALEVFRRGEVTHASADDAADRARLFGWITAAYWLRNDHAACRTAATAALSWANSSGDDSALAAAHTAAGLVASLDHDPNAVRTHYALARRAAERAGDRLALMRVRNNIASRSLEDGQYRSAVAEFDEVIRLAELTGYAWPFALAMHNRGLAKIALGRLDEAAADLTAALHAYENLGSRTAAYPLMRLGEVHRLRGDLDPARLAYEQAVAYARAAGDAQGLVPALAGLARVISDDEPARADTLLAEALRASPGVAETEAILAAGWIALVRGDRSAAADWAGRALSVARSRQHRVRVAEALELAALAGGGDATTGLTEAAAQWDALDNALGSATNVYLRARLADEPGIEAQRRLRVLGVRIDAPRHAAGPLRWLACRNEPPAVALRTLGRFALLRDGVPVPVEQWRSKKSRDLLKFLVAQQGQAVRREVVAEALWPDEPPDKLSNRLSVALSTLRGVLDPDRRFATSRFITADKTTLGLGSLDVDVMTFLRTAHRALRAVAQQQTDAARTLLAEAENLYTGDFVADDPYVDWAVPLRDQARETYVRVVRALVNVAIGNGAIDEAINHLVRLIGLDEYDEWAQTLLVGLLRDSGRHGEARRRHRSYVDRMAELGVNPTPYPR